jgi:hypothetical protein
MTITDILDQAIELSVGFDSVDDDERAFFLKCLNMACEELYRSTAFLDESRFLTYIEKSVDETADIILPSSAVLHVNKVKSASIPKFTKVSLSDMQELKFFSQNQTPVFCFNVNAVTLYSNSLQPYDAFISYVPCFTPLKQSTAESDIPFNCDWHPLLVQGTLYYIYQDMDGFKSGIKEKVTVSEWKDGIMRYCAGLFNSYSPQYRPYTRI